MTSRRVITIHIKQILVAAVCAPLLLHSLRLEAQDPGLQFDPGLGASTTITGKVPDVWAALEVNVVNSSGQPASDARIELRRADGTTVSVKGVGPDGSLRITDLQPGCYEVVASSGIHRSIATVNIFSFTEHLTIHLDSTASGDQSQTIVSVNSLTVPSKVRKDVEAADRLFQKNDIAGAWNHVEKALQVSPKYAPALTLRGLLEITNGRLQEAMNDLSAAVAADRAYQLAYVGLAASHNAMKQFDQALRVLDQGNTLASPSWLAHFEAGRALLGKQDFGRALAEADRARNLLGKDLPILDLLKGYSHLGLRDVTSARLELQQYLQKQSTGAEADKVRAILTRLTD